MLISCKSVRISNLGSCTYLELCTLIFLGLWIFSEESLNIWTLDLCTINPRTFNDKLVLNKTWIVLKTRKSAVIGHVFPSARWARFWLWQWQTILTPAVMESWLVPLNALYDVSIQAILCWSPLKVFATLWHLKVFAEQPPTAGMAFNSWGLLVGRETFQLAPIKQQF